MASLFVKNNEAAELAAEVAQLRGVTKTMAVVDALRKERDSLRPNRKRSAQEMIAWMECYHEEHPLPPKVREADKAFFDELWEEL